MNEEQKSDFTDEQKLMIEINMDWLKEGSDRSNEIVKKNSYIFFANIMFIFLIYNVFLLTNIVGQILLVCSLLSYAFSFIYNILVFNPITLYLNTWDEQKSVNENNHILCKNIEFNRTSVNEQCRKFYISVKSFLVASLVFLSSSFYILINKLF
jgi:hypothetical protein